MTFAALTFFLKRDQVDVVMARSGVFVILVLMELVKLQIIRSQYNLSIFSNLRLIGAVALSAVMAIGVLYIPGVNTLFEVSPLGVGPREDIGLMMVALVLVGVVLSKVLKRS